MPSARPLVSLCVLLAAGLRLLAAADQQAAVINDIAPAVASYGESVTITGTGFGGVNVVVRVGGVQAPIVAASGSRVTFRVPTGVPIGATTVTATNPGGHTGSIGFNLSGNVTLTLDEAHRAGGVIGATGGALTTNVNGITYTLTIPAGALTADEAIVMTPIARMLGLPLDRLIGAAHFAPEGLQFAKPATLAIGVPPTTNTHGLAAFSAVGNGDNLHLTPFTVIGGGIQIPILHFSAAGGGTGSPAATSVVACQQQPQTLECTYMNRLAQAQQQAQQSVCGADCATPEEYGQHLAAINQLFFPNEQQLLGQWFNDVDHLLTTVGRSDDAGFLAARRELAAWANYMQGCDPGASTTCSDVPNLVADLRTGRDDLAAAFVAAFDRAKNACDDRRVEDLAGEVQLLGLLGQGGLPSDFEVLERAYACQMVITASLPALVHLGDTVPFNVTVGRRTGGPTGPVTPLPNASVHLTRTHGCGLFDGSAATLTDTTDATGAVAHQIVVNDTACIAPISTLEVTVNVGDVRTADPGQILAFGRTENVQAHIEMVITVSPANATVAVGATVGYSANVPVKWTATGGTIPAGPSPTATFTAGNTPGTFSVTATLADDPSQSHTVAVTIGNSSLPPPQPPPQQGALSGTLSYSLSSDNPGGFPLIADTLNAFVTADVVDGYLVARSVSGTEELFTSYGSPCEPYDDLKSTLDDLFSFGVSIPVVAGLTPFFGFHASSTIETSTSNVGTNEQPVCFTSTFTSTDTTVTRVKLGISNVIRDASGAIVRIDFVTNEFLTGQRNPAGSLRKN